MFKNKLAIILTLVLTLTMAVPSIRVNEAKAFGTTTTTAADVIVKVGQMGASMYEQSIQGVLYTEYQIGIMADRILWTQEQIGFMADRIVYVTEFSQDNTVKVIYMATTLWPTGTSNGGYLYEVVLTPVAMLPAGW